MAELFDRADDAEAMKFISDAVINLYAANVHSLLYRYNHPLISDSLKNAFQGLRKAFRKKSQIRIETTEEKLMVDGKILDGDFVILGHFKSWLNSLNIKALSFTRDLTRRELIAFHRIISTKKQKIENLFEAMTEKSIENVSVHMGEVSAVPTEIASPDYTANKELIKDYEDTMYHGEKDQAMSPFFIRPADIGPHEDAASYGFIKNSENIEYQPESSVDFIPFGTDSEEKGSMQEMSEGDLYAKCIEALIENGISDDDYSLLKNISPQEMAHFLNAMLFSAPSGEVVNRVIEAYFNGAKESHSEEDIERCRIFLTSLKSFLQQPFLSKCVSFFRTDIFHEEQVIEILSEGLTEQHNCSVTEGDADISSDKTTFVPCRKIEGSDFSFDFVVCGNAVLHDIEIPSESTSLFDEKYLAYFQNDGVLDALYSNVHAAADNTELQNAILMECTEDKITEASFNVIIELLESNSIDDRVYMKLHERIAALVELYSEKGELVNVLELCNALKTQSLQGNGSNHATEMIRHVFSSDKVNTRVVDALRQYGRKQRDIAYKLTSALKSFISPYLLDALSEEADTSTRRFIMSLLTSIRSEAAYYISKRLSDSSWYVVRNVLYLLRECRGTRYKVAVRNCLEHEVPLVRIEALSTLLSFQDPDADDYVIKFLCSDVLQLQKGAIRLAGAYRFRGAVPHLLRLLEEKDLRKKRVPFKNGIIRALGRIGDRRAVKHLLNICRSKNGLRKNEFDKLKIEIFKTLHNYPAVTIKPLIDYGTHSSNEKIEAISKKLMKRYNLSKHKTGILA